jgi:hypothetical protein
MDQEQRRIYEELVELIENSEWFNSYLKDQELTEIDWNNLEDRVRKMRSDRGFSDDE